MLGRRILFVALLLHGKLSGCNHPASMRRHGVVTGAAVASSHFQNLLLVGYYGKQIAMLYADRQNNLQRRLKTSMY